MQTDKLAYRLVQMDTGLAHLVAVLAKEIADNLAAAQTDFAVAHSFGEVAQKEAVDQAAARTDLLVALEAQTDLVVVAHTVRAAAQIGLSVH